MILSSKQFWRIYPETLLCASVFGSLSVDIRKPGISDAMEHNTQAASNGDEKIV